MEAATEKKTVWVKPTRKMTMDELWANFVYDPDYEDDDPAYERAIYDRYGNPTYGTLCAMYEEEHGLLEGPYTIDELFAEFDKWREEADLEDSKAQQEIQAGLQAWS